MARIIDDNDCGREFTKSRLDDRLYFGYCEGWNRAVKMAEEKFPSPNTGSPKLPSSTEVWNHVMNSIEFDDDYARTEDARLVSKTVYEFIYRQLRAGA